MCKFIRFVNQGIQDIFIIDGEDLGNGCDQFENRLPDSLCDSQFATVLFHLSEEFSDSLVVHEALHGREYVILECHEGRACNLCCKVGRLAFAKSEQSFALLEDDLLRPTPRVNPVCLGESQIKVSRKQGALWPMLAADDDIRPKLAGDMIHQLAPEERLLVHSYTLNHVHNGKHCPSCIIIFEKCAYL